MTQELVNSLNSQIEKRIHGPGREQILAAFEQDPTADGVAEIVYEIIVSVASQAESRGAPLDVAILMGVATETIDMLLEILAAMGTDMVVEEMQEESLIKVMMLHMETVQDDPEEVAAAQEMLAEMTGDGTMQAVMNHIGDKASASPEEMLTAGAAMAQPQKTPLAGGIQQGLME